MPSTATNRRERREGRRCPWTQRLWRSSRSWAGKNSDTSRMRVPQPHSEPGSITDPPLSPAYQSCCPLHNAVFPLGSTGSLVGRRLAIIGDDINKRYDAEFRYMLKSLQPTKENVYEHFTRIASR